MRNASNILRHELIGLDCTVVKASNRDQVGIQGKITNETMKTIMIGARSVPKKDSVFRVKLDARTVDIDGDYLLARPEDRIKKKIQKW